MTVAEILSQYRRGPKSVIVERLHDGNGILIAYRITQTQRFTSLSQAKEDYLSTISPGRREYYEKELNEKCKKFEEAKHDRNNKART